MQVLDYTYLNYNYISEELCISKNSPKLHCNGKCFWKKNWPKMHRMTLSHQKQKIRGQKITDLCLPVEISRNSDRILYTYD
jgi:hypothetical protein